MARMKQKGRNSPASSDGSVQLKSKVKSDLIKVTERRTVMLLIRCLGQIIHHVKLKQTSGKEKEAIQGRWQITSVPDAYRVDPIDQLLLQSKDREVLCSPQITD